MKTCFDNEKYLQVQSEHIKERIKHFGDKLYLEFGGKLLDDYHASRVLPGFLPDSKVRMLEQLKSDLEIVIVINANDIRKNKIREDLGIRYDEDVLKIKSDAEGLGFLVNGVCITHYNGQREADIFRKRLKKLKIKSYIHYAIDNYPYDIPLINSEKGYGKNDYIPTTKALIVVTAPGPGSGKMATCLSQLYQDNKRGIKAGYAKFETFPIWNLPLKHPINLAYEAATADLKDVNVIDNFHLETYGVSAVNYNRDIEIFPVLQKIFTSIYGKSPYASPTDMGVNMAGFCITDNEGCKEAARQEIIRRYYTALAALSEGMDKEGEVVKIHNLLEQAGLSLTDRPVVKGCLERAAKERAVIGAMQLSSGKIITASASPLLSAASALVLNSLKEISGIEHSVKLIPKKSITLIQGLNHLYKHKDSTPLHIDEMLVALTLLQESDSKCLLAVNAIPKLDRAQVHINSVVSSADKKAFKRLGCDLTYETASAA